MGTELLRSTSFHLATDGQTECTNRTLKDMLQAVALERQGSWDEYLGMVKFCIAIVLRQASKRHLLRLRMVIGAAVQHVGIILSRLLLWVRLC